MANDFRLRLFHGTQKFWFVFLRSGFGSVNPPEKNPPNEMNGKMLSLFLIVVVVVSAVSAVVV